MAFYLNTREVVVTVIEDYFEQDDRNMVAVVAPSERRDRVVAVFCNEIQARNWVRNMFSEYGDFVKKLSYIPIKIDNMQVVEED